VEALFPMDGSIASNGWKAELLTNINWFDVRQIIDEKPIFDVIFVCEAPKSLVPLHCQKREQAAPQQFERARLHSACTVLAPTKNKKGNNIND
jgi:hypothetical protein